MHGMGGVMSTPLRGMGGMQDEPMGSGILIGEAKKYPRATILLSGGFSSGSLDGWVGPGTRSTANFRSSPSRLSMAFGGGGTFYQTYEIPADSARKRRITAAVWHRFISSAGVTVSRSICYQIGDGPIIVADTNNDAVATYSQFVVTFDNPEEKPVTILLRTTSSVSHEAAFDDWSIEMVDLLGITS